MSDDARKRVEAELGDVSARIKALGAFLYSQSFNALSDVQRSLLIVQKDAMETYRSVLLQRLTQWDK